MTMTRPIRILKSKIKNSGTKTNTGSMINLIKSIKILLPLILITNPEEVLNTMISIDHLSKNFINILLFVNIPNFLFTLKKYLKYSFQI